MAQKFSRAERQAYHSGKGYAVASQKRGIHFKDGKNSKIRRAFAAGFKKGNEMMGRNPEKYPKIRTKKNTKKRG